MPHFDKSLTPTIPIYLKLKVDIYNLPLISLCLLSTAQSQEHSGANYLVVLYCLTFFSRSFALVSVSKCLRTGSRMALRFRFKPSFKSPGCSEPSA